MRAKGRVDLWPIPLDGLLDRLLVLVDEAAQKTSRKELAAAIVFSAPRDGEALAQMLMNYRRATVADVAPQGSEGENVVPFRIRRPGPRTQTDES